MGVGFLISRLRWICNPPALNISICNAFSGFEILIINNIGIANPDEPRSLGAVARKSIVLTPKLLNSLTPQKKLLNSLKKSPKLLKKPPHFHHLLSEK